jgi:hypothetical protein
MTDPDTITRSVSDLGAGAYLLMHGYKVVGRQGKDIMFEITPNEIEEFETLQLEYLRSEFHRFDACIMSLKKIQDHRNL